MENTFISWICRFFKEHLGIDLNNYRDNDTRRYDIDSLLFINWNLVPDSKKQIIDKFATKNKDRFVINTIYSGLRCIAEVRGNRRD